MDRRKDHWGGWTGEKTTGGDGQEKRPLEKTEQGIFMIA
jgi:hypothetical protein